MEFDQIVETLNALPAEDQWRWLAGALGVLLAVVLAFFIESRFFKKSGRLGSWFALRVLSLVLAPVTVAAVMLPPQAVAGMEGLAVFYLLLVTVGPLLWFGSHMLCGRWLRPALTNTESVLLAISGAVIFSLPVMVFFAAQYPLHNAAHNLTITATPLAHAIEAPQRFAMPGAGVVFTQALMAPPGLVLEKVEQRFGGGWYETQGVSHPVFCTQGSDLHLMWSAQEPPPKLRLYWREGNGLPRTGVFVPDAALLDAAAAAEKTFTVSFRPDGFDPVVPIPRVRVHLEILRQDGTVYTDMLASAQTGGKKSDDCLMQGFTRRQSAQGGSVKMVGIMFYLPSGRATLRGELRPE